MSPTPVLLSVVQALGEVRHQGRSLNTLLQDKSLSPRQTAWLYGSLRGLHRYQALLQPWLKQPLKGRNRAGEDLLLISLWRLLEGRQPPHAVVNDALHCLPALKLGHLKGLVNAILRRAGREWTLDALQQHPDPVIRTAHPAWLLERLQQDWPEHWQNIAQANRQQAPMWLRLKPEALNAPWADDWPAPLPTLPEARRLQAAVDVQALPGFAEGLVSVQDAGAQCAAHAFGQTLQGRVLDGCAAPGGKACHLLECFPGIQLTAVELEAHRARRIEENLQRLGLNARLEVADLAQTDAWWDGQPFAAILLDAPCSASGVIRRHPDILSLRRASDIAALAETQARLLDAVWPTLAPGGRLLYCTCSVLQAENSRQIQSFLQRTPDAREQPLALPAGRALTHGWQILPGEADMDGFYYALLEKSHA